MRTCSSMKLNRNEAKVLSTLEKMLLQKHVNAKEREYEAFMGGAVLPMMSLKPLSIGELLRNPAWATVMYDPRTDRYELQIFDHIHDPNVVTSSDYLLFHEFTHALDISLYGAGDVNKYNALRGYLEYHAAQVEMMRLVGASKITDPVEFSMNDTITDIEGEKSVLEYVEHGIEVVTSAMAQPGFKADMAQVFRAVGALYNHLGRLSICQLASPGFDQYANDLMARCPGAELFGQVTWSLIINVFRGIMPGSAIQMSGQIYLGSLFQLFKIYGIQP